MTIAKDDRDNLIKYRLGQAEETVLDVQLLIENNRYRSAVNRIYYGIFYALLALGLAYQFETAKHTQLIGWFNKTFIHEGLIDTKYGKIVNKAFNRRTKGDYDTYVQFEKDILVEMFNEMWGIVIGFENSMSYVVGRMLWEQVHGIRYIVLGRR